MPVGYRVTKGIKVFHVLAVRGEDGCAAASLQIVQHGVDFILVEYRLLE